MRVLYIQYTNPAGYPPLDHSAQLLAEAGCDVLLLGTRSEDDSLALTPHERVNVKLIPFEPAGWRQKLHYARFASWAMSWAWRWRPDWIYASDPPASPITLAIRTMLNVRVIYHEHDSPGAAVAGGESGSSVVRAIMAARRKLARSADVVVIPNATRADAYRRVTGRSDVLTIWNCPLRREVIKGSSLNREKNLRVLYHGSIVPARLPRTVIEALSRVSTSVTLDIVGYDTVGHPKYVEQLLGWARELGLSERVRFRGAMNRADLMRHCAEYDVGLTLLPARSSDLNERTMVGASNKAFDYMAGGLALLVPTNPEWERTFVERGFGLSCDADSVESIARALNQFVERPNERAAMGERGRQQILSEWNYETVFAPVLSQIAGSLYPVVELCRP